MIWFGESNVREISRKKIRSVQGYAISQIIVFLEDMLREEDDINTRQATVNKTVSIGSF